MFYARFLSTWNQTQCATSKPKVNEYFNVSSEKNVSNDRKSIQSEPKIRPRKKKMGYNLSYK